jgi:hypothetical protein
MDSVGHREVVAGAALVCYAVAELVWALAVRGRADLDMLLGRVICTPTTPTHTSAHTNIVISTHAHRSAADGPESVNAISSRRSPVVPVRLRVWRRRQADSGVSV